MKIKVLSTTVAMLLGACSSLALTPGGEKVRVLDPADVASCRELGRTNNQVTPVMVVERPIEAVTKELGILARNSASRMGGDTIVPLTVIENGQQTFVVYKCVNPNG